MRNRRIVSAADGGGEIFGRGNDNASRHFRRSRVGTLIKIPFMSAPFVALSSATITAYTEDE
jgi:hypothetical protein